MSEQWKIEMIKGVEGRSLYLCYGDEGGYRIAGNKPWGGGNVIGTWVVSKEDLLKGIEQCERTEARIKKDKQ